MTHPTVKTVWRRVQSQSLGNVLSDTMQGSTSEGFAVSIGPPGLQNQMNKLTGRILDEHVVSQAAAQGGIRII